MRMQPCSWDLLWLIPQIAGREELIRLIGSVALSAYRKIPARAHGRLRSATPLFYALSEMISPDAIGQLAMLKVRVRFGTAQKEIEKALDAAASALNLPRTHIEEMRVPSCGLETVGRREETVGGVSGGIGRRRHDAGLKWFDGRGRQLKAAPISLKKDHAETLKELLGLLEKSGVALMCCLER